MDNSKIYEFENLLKQVILGSELPPAIVYYILDKTTGEIYNLYMQCVQQEFKQKEEIEKKVNEGLAEKIEGAVEEALQTGQE